MKNRRALPKNIKPLSQCKTLDDVLTNVSHLCNELNQIKGVKATYSVGRLNDHEK